MARELILALDQGTTSSRALLTDGAGREVAIAQVELKSAFPRSGWVEQDPEQIWHGQLEAAQAALRQAGCTASDLAGLGITNQRETTLLWDRVTGRALAPAIVWQDRRCADLLSQMRNPEFDDQVRRLTGLQLDAYFSAGKIRWLLDNDAAVQAAAKSGTLAFGTVDSWLLHRLTRGDLHATDATNASRTLLFDTGTLEWSADLLGRFEIPQEILPEVRPSMAEYGHVHREVLGAEIPIAAVAGDQHAAAFGQACFDAGMAKNTYGTGCFMVQTTGTTRVLPDDGLLGTLAWQEADGTVLYAVEGSVFTAGAAIQWLRDGLGIIREAAEIETLARSVADNGDVYLVPALTGLGAPQWDSSARGIIAGISRGTTSGHIARATLEGIAMQVAEVFRLFTDATGMTPPALRVDGGAARSDLLLQIQADALGVPVTRTSRMESTAYGAAFMAGLQAGVWSSASDVSRLWRAESTFEPSIGEDERQAWFARWRKAVQRSLAWVD